MSGNHGKGEEDFSMWQGNAGTPRNRDPRAHAGYDLEADSGSRQRLRLFAAAAENEWVAALKAHHVPAGARMLDQNRVDLLLRQAVITRRLAGEDAQRFSRRFFEQRLDRKSVVDDHFEQGAARRSA